MFGINSLSYLFLLQDNISYFKEDDPVSAMILGIAIGAIIIVATLVHFIRRGTSVAVVGKNKGAAVVTPRKFNGFTLRRISETYGLDRDQTRLLEYVFRNDAVSDPERVMKNPPLLDRHFKRTFRTIEKNSPTDEEAQERLAKLFTLRNTIEGSPGADSESSGRLSENTPAILAIGKDSYPVKVLVSRGQNVITEIPRNVLGSPIRPARGTKVTLSFFTKISSGFSLNGQITGTINTDHGTGLQITHSGKAKSLTKRKFRRKQIDIKCDFFFVNVEESGSGRKKTSRLVADPRRFMGTVQDISAGGCSMKVTAPIPVGSRLKIIMDYDADYLINTLGQVIRSNRSGAGTVIHVKFLKVPRRAFNSINTLVFGYNDD